MRALVIVGHGSHLNGDSSLPVYEHAERIKATGEFDEVVECFWKEEPSMRHVLDTVEAEDVSVVPAFISEGYFTQQVIPRELRLDGHITHKGGKIIRYAGPLGTFEGMADVILERAEDLLRDKEIPPGQRALVLLGHGTDLNKSSGGVIYLNAGRIRERGVYDLVEVGFLDQEPGIGEVVENVEAENVILIPMFIAEGWHTRETIPKDLGLTCEVTVREHKTIFYGAPVGTHPSMANLIAARARETVREEQVAGSVTWALSARSRAAASREAFAAWIEASVEGRVFGQVLIRRTSPACYSLRHQDDANAEDLKVHEDPRTAREIAKLTEAGEYRPLKSSPNLRRGWEIRASDAGELAVAMNYLYPAGIVHWHLLREGRLEITNLRTNAARQSGIYKRIQRLSDKGVQDAARACCEDKVCLKKTLWDVDERTALEMERGEGEIPCPEPCSVFISFARRVRLFERERDLDAAGLSSSEKEDLVALVEAAATGEVRFAREAEFEEPLNERRMRYRRHTLVPKLRS